MNLAADLLVFALALAGFAFLSAGMDRHALQIFGQPPRPAVRRLRVRGGALALLLALAPAIKVYGLSVGIAVWFGFLALASTLLGLLLAYRPRALRLVFSVVATGALFAALLEW
ncbi:MAG: DUF3325 domain-containing protein [Candidatus Accumulibacter sp.]|jgi:hypothetical protein|nr:DUF3325 domain-containing protein [Accumulibacter sp.]